MDWGQLRPLLAEGYPHLDSHRVYVGSGGCRKEQGSDPGLSPCWSRLSSFLLLGANLPLVCPILLIDP